MKRYLTISVGSLLAVLLLTALVVDIGATPPAATAKAAVQHVTIKNFAFTPKTLTVTAGTKVVWTNKDSVQHTVTSTKTGKLNTPTTNMFNSGLFGKGKTFSFTFKKKGTFFYECTIHKAMASMHAKVVVK